MTRHPMQAEGINIPAASDCTGDPLLSRPVGPPRSHAEQGAGDL